MITESVERVTHEDPAQGEWCINREEMNVWVHASSFVVGNPVGEGENCVGRCV